MIVYGVTTTRTTRCRLKVPLTELRMIGASAQIRKSAARRADGYLCELLNRVPRLTVSSRYGVTVTRTTRWILNVPLTELCP